MVQKTIFSLSMAVFFFLRARKKNSHGSPSNINQHTLSESHAKFGAFIRPVTVISLSHLTTFHSQMDITWPLYHTHINLVLHHTHQNILELELEYIFHWSVAISLFCCNIFLNISKDITLATRMGSWNY